MSAHKPTAEQQAIIEASITGKSGVVEAGAGTGKTSTLRMIAEANPTRKFLYLAYNKAIQLEAAASFPENVTCKTAHSVAYAVYGRKFQRRLNARRLSAKQTAAALDIKPFSFQMEVDGEMVDFTKSPRQIAVILREAIGHFCNSADTEPNQYHIPYEKMTKEANGRKGDSNFQRFVAHCQPYLARYWADITNYSGQLNFTHDCYLKMWSLDTPQLPYDCVLFDEAQDANPCIAYVVENQKGTQTIMVGDRAQAIYGWRGAIDAMENFKADWHLYLTQSFRFGQAVADQANRWLNIVGTPLRLSGFERIISTVESTDKPNAVLCRTNAGCIESALKYQQAGLKVSITGGTKDIERFAYAANDLMQGKGTDHPELGAYRDWTEVQAAVKDGEAADLGMMVRLVDNYGTHSILEVCRNSVKPEDSDIVVSTAHKAKGLEWDHVQIHNDFKPNKEGGVSVTEAMLIYVAVTRAKLTLDNTNLTWLDQLEADLADTSDEGEAA